MHPRHQGLHPPLEEDGDQMGARHLFTRLELEFAHPRHQWGHFFFFFFFFFFG
jgi:hypothetical protein